MVEYLRLSVIEFIGMLYVVFIGLIIVFQCVCKKQLISIKGWWAAERNRRFIEVQNFKN